MTNIVDDQARCAQCNRPLAPGRPRCLWCGAEAPQDEEQQVPLTCPICEKTLAEAKSDEWTVQLCESCGGVWLTAANLHRLEQLHDYQSAGVLTPGASIDRQRQLGQPDLRAGIQDAKPVYRHCPRCQRQMARRRYQRVSGVVVDECMGHGVWFDSGELKSVIAFLEAGGLDAARQYDKAYAASRARFSKDLGSLKRITKRGYYGW
jgi:Zn-finger nucleic acid-binding protein